MTDKILIDRELLERAKKLARFVIVMADYDIWRDKAKALEDDIQAELDAPQQEAVPVAWITSVQVGGGPEDPPDWDVVLHYGDAPPNDKHKWAPLYLHPAPSVPEGWQLVPKEPTPEMCHAAFKDRNGNFDSRSQYLAMLSAAPKAPSADDRKDELAADSKHALELLGSIYYCGHFVAETRNEQELETLMRKHGYFIETEAQFDAYCQRAANAERRHEGREGMSKCVLCGGKNGTEDSDS